MKEITAMNLQELAAFIAQALKEQEVKTQQVEGLKTNVYNELKKLVELSGNYEAVEDIFKSISTPQDPEQPAQIENAPVETPEEEVNPVETMDSVEAEEPAFEEYESEEEYNLMLTRSKMLPPLEMLLSENSLPRIEQLGYVHELKSAKSFKQHQRAINAMSSVGNTLTTEYSPHVYIPAPKPVESEMKKCA